MTRQLFDLALRQFNICRNFPDTESDPGQSQVVDGFVFHERNYSIIKKSASCEADLISYGACNNSGGAFTPPLRERRNASSCDISVGVM